MNTLYIVGGASRAGKTCVAEKLLKERDVPYFCVDYFTAVMHHALPKLGIFHELEPAERAERLWPLLTPMLGTISYSQPHYLIEGDALLPEHIKAFEQGSKHDVRTCFLGYTKISVEDKMKAVQAYTGGVNNWTNGLPEEALLKHIEEKILFSQYIEKECEKYQLNYVDTSVDFEGSVDRAIACLLNDE